MDRTERLLRMGYLPSQLPPPFSTNDLATNYTALGVAWAALQTGQAAKMKLAKSPSAKPEIFSVARAGHQRRATSIPNPIPQTYLSAAIVENWGAIVRLYRKSRISTSHPRFRRDGKRAASLPSMRALYERRIVDGAGYRYVLRTDVSRFFPTIYTHSIPWAIHGKAIAKKNRTPTPKYWGNLIDLACRQVQDEQTFGLPIGPDTSHIIAECIATAVDIELARKIRAPLAGFRYVDDFYLFFDTYAAAEAALALLIRSLKEFELQINFEKTTICRTEDLEDDAWSHTLRRFSLDSGGTRQRSSINHFFEIARGLAKAHSDESVMVYALRRISSSIIRKENWNTFEAHLCHVAIAHPVTMQSIARILSTYASLGYQLNSSRLSRLVNSVISEHAPLEHHSEVVWALWIAKELDIQLRTENIDLVAQMNSAACVLILLDLAASGKLAKVPLPNRWKQFETTDALMEEMWMLSYEAGLRGWGGMTDAHLRSSPYFEELRVRDVHFYDPSAKISPLFVLKPSLRSRLASQTLEKLLDSANPDELFDYEDDDDEYGSVIEGEDDEVEDF